MKHLWQCTTNFTRVSYLIPNIKTPHGEFQLG